MVSFEQPGSADQVLCNCNTYKGISLHKITTVRPICEKRNVFHILFVHILSLFNLSIGKTKVRGLIVIPCNSCMKTECLRTG